MKRIKLKKWIIEELKIVSPVAECSVEETAQNIVRYVQNNYRRLKHKPYIKKGEK